MLEADTTQNIDVLFLGSPHAFRGFDPRIFEKAGFRSFNLGSPSQTPFQTKLLLEKYLDQLNSAYVVFEVYPATFQNDGVESSLDLMANMEGFGNSFTMVRAVPHVRTVNALIYDGFREQLNLNQGFEEGLTAGQDTYVPQGFVESRVQSNQSPITDKIRQSWASDTWQIRDWQ